MERQSGKRDQVGSQGKSNRAGGQASATGPDQASTLKSAVIRT